MLNIKRLIELICTIKSKHLWMHIDSISLFGCKRRSLL